MKKCIILFLGLYLCSCHKRPASKTGLEGKPMPSIDLLLLDSSTHIDPTRLSSNKPIVLFYFSPHCPYCRALTHEIADRDKSLKDIQFVLLTPFPIADAKKFYQEFELGELSNVITGIDYKYSFAAFFGTTQVPCLAVYNKQRRLIQVNLGMMPTREIKSIALDGATVN
jgi:thiol-disulfide isomerase/thioredoxin